MISRLLDTAGYEPGSDLLRIVFYIAAVAIVLVLAYFVSRWLARRSFHAARSKFFRVLDRVSITKDKSIMLVEAGGRYYVMGISDNAISLVSEVSASEIPESLVSPGARRRERQVSAEPAPPGARSGGVFGLFLRNFGRFFKGFITGKPVDPASIERAARPPANANAAFSDVLDKTLRKAASSEAAVPLYTGENRQRARYASGAVNTAVMRPAPPVEMDLSAAQQLIRMHQQGASMMGARPVRAAGFVAEPESVAVAQAEPVAVVQAEPVAVVQAEPVAVVQAEPVAVAQAEPVAVAQAEPVAVAQAEPVAVAQAEPVAVAQAEPVAVAQAESVAVAQAESVAVARTEPVAVAQAEPVAVAQAEPVTVAQAEPVAVAQAESVAVAQAEPVAVARTEPVAVAQAEPVAVVQAEPVAVAQAEPVAVAQAEPVAVVQAEPVAVAQAEPVAVAQAEPVAVAQPEPVAVAQAEPVAVAQAEPVAVAEPEPVAVAQPEPVAVVQAEPVAVVQAEPVAVAQAEPVAVAQPEPVAVAQAEPVAVAQAEPVAVAEPEPVAVAQPEPVAVVQAEPVAVVQAEPVAVAEPEPVAVAQPEPVAVVQAEPVAVVQAEPVAVVQAEPVAVAQAEPVAVARTEPVAVALISANLADNMYPTLDDIAKPVVFGDSLPKSVDEIARHESEPAPISQPVNLPEHKAELEQPQASNATDKTKHGADMFPELEAIARPLGAPENEPDITPEQILELRKSAPKPFTAGNVYGNLLASPGKSDARKSAPLDDVLDKSARMRDRFASKLKVTE